MSETVEEIEEPTEPEEQPEIEVEVPKKTCRSCSQAKPLGQFSFAANSADLKDTMCKACVKLENDARMNHSKAIRLEDRVEWTSRRIAEYSYTPLATGDWSGRETIVEVVSNQFRIEKADAEKIVNETVKRLFDETDPTSRVLRKLMVLRLETMRNYIHGIITRPKVKKVYKVVKGKRILDRVDVLPNQANIQAIAKWIELEEMVARLQGLETEGARGGAMTQILALIGNNSGANIENLPGESGAAKIRNMLPEHLSHVGRFSMENANRKMITAKKVVNANKSTTNPG